MAYCDVQRDSSALFAALFVLQISYQLFHSQFRTLNELLDTVKHILCDFLIVPGVNTFLLRFHAGIFFVLLVVVIYFAECSQNLYDFVSLFDDTDGPIFQILSKIDDFHGKWR